jgi:hypothetical protein
MEVEERLPEEAIAARTCLAGRQVHWVRSQKVMLDADLARLYGVPTKELNLKVKRHLERFPADFMFQLTDDEWSGLRFQVETSKGRGGRRYPPYAFTEHGVLMSPTRQSRYGDGALSSVLNSERAIAVNTCLSGRQVRIMRVFVRMNRLLQSDLELQLRMERMETRQGRMEEDLGGLFEAVKQLMEEPGAERRRLGYKGGDTI